MFRCWVFGLVLGACFAAGLALESGGRSQHVRTEQAGTLLGMKPSTRGIQVGFFKAVTAWAVKRSSGVLLVASHGIFVDSDINM